MDDTARAVVLDCQHWAGPSGACESCIAAALQAAVQAERERCAKIAEAFCLYDHTPIEAVVDDVQRQIAAAIRLEGA